MLSIWIYIDMSMDYNNFNFSKMGCGATSGTSTPNPKQLKSSKINSSRLSRSLTKYENTAPVRQEKQEKKDDLKKSGPPEIFTQFDGIDLRKSTNNSSLRESKSNSKMVKVKTARKISHNPEATLSPIRESRRNKW